MGETAVLVVDDEQNILNSLKRVFLNESFELLTTTDFQEGFKLLESGKIKAIMSDQRMPGISGVEFLKKVKEKYPTIIRILFTGYADIQAAEDAINKGEVYRFINKPWNDEDLKSTIREAIKHFDLVEENKRLFQLTQKQNEELKTANERLKSMYEIQKEFTSTVSHELRTPLASMKAAIDILITGTTGTLTSEQNKFLDIAKRNVDRLNGLINDILDLSKLESGKIELNLVDTNINQLIQEIVEAQKPVAEKKGLFLKADLDICTELVKMDSDRIIQVLTNLVNNAIKFTEKGGVLISSSYKADRNFVSVCVKDTGYGVKTEDLPKLFQKFQQLGHPAERQQGGTGLGLAICKEIIDRHHGKIWVESEHGKGSSFYFLLPIKERRDSDRGY